MSYLYQKVCNHIRVLPLLEKSHGGHRKVKQKKKKKEKKRRKKRIKKRGATLLSFIKVVLMFSTCIIHSHHLCSWLAPILHVREFSCFTSITMWGILHYRTWVVYSNDELPQKCSRSSWATELDAPPLVPLESFHTHIALCASVAWQYISEQLWKCCGR